MKKRFFPLILTFAMSFNSSFSQENSIPVSLGMRIATLRYAEVDLPQNGLLPVWQSDKCGFLSLNGEMVMKPTYEKDKSDSKIPADYQFRNGFMRVIKDGKYGYIDQTTKEVIACQYDDARDFSEGKAAVKSNGLWGYINEQGKLIANFGYKEAYPYSCGMAAVVNENDSLGFVDSFGLLIVPFSYDKVENLKFKDSVCIVRKNGEQIVIDTKGNVLETTITPPRSKVAMSNSKSQLEKLRATALYDQAPTPFDELGVFNNGYAIVMQKNTAGKKKYGVLTSKGKIVVPCEYDQIEGPFSSAVEYFIVEKDGLRGAIKTDGSALFPCNYQKVFSVGSEMIMVQKDGLLGFINKKGELTIPCKYEDAAAFNASVTGVSAWKKDKKVWNFINQKGEEVATPEYEEILPFCNGICPVKKKGKWGFVNEEMKPISSFKYDYSFSDVREKWSFQWSKSDLIPVSKEGKYGFINHQGKEIIPCQYEDALAFIGGVARVQKGGKYGYINEKGELVIECKYDKATSFRNGFAIVTRGGIRYTLDAAGVEKANQNISENSNEVCPSQVIEKDGLFGMKDENGKQLTDCVFDQIGSFENGYAPLKIVNKWGVIDCSGKIVVPCLYDDIKNNGENLFSVKVAGKRGVVDVTGKSLLQGDTKKVNWIPLTEDKLDIVR